MRLRIKSPRGWFQQLLFFTCRSMVDDVKATSETYAKRGLGYLTWGKGDDCPWPLIFHTLATTPSRRYHKWDDLKLAPYNLEGIGNLILKFKVIHPMLKMSCDKALGTNANNFGRLPPARACCGVSMRGARVFTPLWEGPIISNGNTLASILSCFGEVSSLITNFRKSSVVHIRCSNIDINTMLENFPSI
jgi:hypothetical protein